MERKEVTRLTNKAEDLRDYPGAYFPARAIARAAMAQWEQEHPVEAAEEKAIEAKWEAEDQARRAGELKTSFIGRGLD